MTTQTQVEIRHFHLFCGLGGGAKGFNKSKPRVGNLVGKYRCIGGIDIDAPAIRDFERLSGTRGTVLDLFDRDQFIAFHGKEPPSGWREATPADICLAAGNEVPHVVFLSAPCKGFSGLLAEGKSKTDKYQALNRLTLRGIWLMLEAWKNDPVAMIVFENVPRIANRGRHLLDQINGLLKAYGYAVAETTHDCGEIGGLAQSRKRFLLVARHVDKVPNFLYEPEKKPLRAVGDILGRMQLPGDQTAGPMHRIPRLQWKTWVRLAFVEAGSDWRSLNKLAVEDGVLRDYLIVPCSQDGSGSYGVRHWDETSGAVRGRSGPSNGAFSIADPRSAAGALQYQQYGVLNMTDTAGAVIGVKSPGQGTFSVADMRPPKGPLFTKYPVTDWEGSTGTVISGDDTGAYAVADLRHEGPAKHSNEFRIVPWDNKAQAVTSAHGTGQALADPRASTGFEGKGKYRITGYDSAAGTVIAGSTTGQGAFAVADPKSALQRGKGDDYLTGGHYGVLTMDQPSGAVSASACHDNGRWSVADTRIPEQTDKLVCRITSLDGTWHRPFTTLELAALQSLYDPEEHWSADPMIQLEINKWNDSMMARAPFQLEGESDQAWRERIGNAVPSDAAEEIGNVIGTTLLLAWSGETFTLSASPIWVRPIAIAIAVAQRDPS